jgi:hypothetical protein
MMGEQPKKTVSLSGDLYDRIVERARLTGFASVEEYVTFVLEEILKEDEDESKPAYTKEEEQEVKKRLKALGYLE